MKKIVISCGPIPARLDSVKFITNRFKGRLAFKTAAFLHDNGCNLTIIKWKYTPLPKNLNCPDITVIDVEDVFEYAAWFEQNARDYNAFVMAAAVANLTPSSPFPGKFPSHNYKVGESFDIKFEIAPRAIDIVKKVNPRCCLIGYKLFDAATEEELVDIAKHTLTDAKANIIFANTPSTASTKKIAVMADGSVIPCDFQQHLDLMLQAIQAEYFRTECIDKNELMQSDEVRMAMSIVKMFDKTFPGFGTVAVPVNGHRPMFVTTSRGHNGDPVLVDHVDMQNKIVYATGKATLNAPTLAAALEYTDWNCIIVHRHEHDPLYKPVIKRNFDGSFLKYQFPGSDEEATSVMSEIANLRHNGCNGIQYPRIKLFHHGDISVVAIQPVNWELYYDQFPDKYFSTPQEMLDFIKQYDGQETLEVGANRKSTAKYVYDPYVQADNAINISWHSVLNKQFDCIFIKNAINYLTKGEIAELLRHTKAFIANTFLIAPEEKITNREAAVLTNDKQFILHALRLDDDSIATHKFFAYTREDYENLGLEVIPYGKNSALLRKQP